jgi:hypothetical protein
LESRTTFTVLLSARKKGARTLHTLYAFAHTRNGLEDRIVFHIMEITSVRATPCNKAFTLEEWYAKALSAEGHLLREALLQGLKNAKAEFDLLVEYLETQ